MNPEVERRVEELLSRMTLDEKIGQMIMVEKDYLASPVEIKNYCIGALLSGRDSKPATNTPEEWAKMIDSYQSIALSTRLKIPLLYGVDAVNGNGKTVDTVIFPHNIGLGCTRDPELIRKMAEVTAIETYALSKIGQNFTSCVRL
ncbi:MAG: glycoside hydrolase family 3 N-terminal domain-containing protein [Brevinematia bacterium]